MAEVRSPSPPLLAPPTTTIEPRSASSSVSSSKDFPAVTTANILVPTTTTPTRASSTTLNHATASTPHAPPPLNFTFKPLIPILYIIFLLLFNLAVPCILYYVLKDKTNMDGKELIGIASAALGLSSCFDAPFRLYKLVKFHKAYGPLNDAKWYHLDFFMWVYTISLFSFAFPLAIAPAVPVYQFFVFSPAMLVAPVAIIFLLSLKPIKYPLWLSSDPPKRPDGNKPALFYILEDVVAVDFGHGRAWRESCYERYEASKGFRTLMWNLTLYWGLMGLVFTGATAAVTWTTSVQFAFGFILGLFFIWALAAGLGSFILTKQGLKKEYKVWQRIGGEGQEVTEHGMREWK